MKKLCIKSYEQLSMSQLLHFFHCHHQLCPFSIFIITIKMITTMSFIHFQRGTLCAKGTFGPSHKVPPICYCLCNSQRYNVYNLNHNPISIMFRISIIFWAMAQNAPLLSLYVQLSKIIYLKSKSKSNIYDIQKFI